MNKFIYSLTAALFVSNMAGASSFTTLEDMKSADAHKVVTTVRNNLKNSMAGAVPEEANIITSRWSEGAQLLTHEVKSDGYKFNITFNAGFMAAYTMPGSDTIDNNAMGPNGNGIVRTKEDLGTYFSNLNAFLENERSSKSGNQAPAASTLTAKITVPSKKIAFLDETENAQSKYVPVTEMDAATPEEARLQIQFQQNGKGHILFVFGSYTAEKIQ